MKEFYGLYEEDGSLSLFRDLENAKNQLLKAYIWKRRPTVDNRVKAKKMVDECWKIEGIGKNY